MIHLLQNPENLRYLSRILAGLTDPKSPLYDTFWTWFASAYPENRRQTHMQNAWRALGEFKTFVDGRVNNG